MEKLTQDWIDELSGNGNGSPGNPGSGGNGCDSVCENANPNSMAYELCGCGGGELAASIDVNLWVLFALALILIVVVSLKKSHWKSLKIWFLKWSKSCPNETKW